MPQRGARPQGPGQGARANEEKPTRPGPRPGATGARVREILGPWPGGPGEGRKNPGPRPRGPGEGTHPPNPIKYAQLDDSRGCGIPTRCATSVHLASVSGYLAPRAGGGEGPGIQIKQVVGDNGNPGRTHARVYPERLYPDRLLPDSCATFFFSERREPRTRRESVIRCCSCCCRHSSLGRGPRVNSRRISGRSV